MYNVHTGNNTRGFIASSYRDFIITPRGRFS